MLLAVENVTRTVDSQNSIGAANGRIVRRRGRAAEAAARRAEAKLGNHGFADLQTMSDRSSIRRGRARPMRGASRRRRCCPSCERWPGGGRAPILPASRCT